MAYERLDPVLLPVLAAAPEALTSAQLRERCGDPWAPPLVEDWLREAFHRGLVNVYGRGEAPSQWRLTGKGRRAARQLQT